MVRDIRRFFHGRLAAAVLFTVMTLCGVIFGAPVPAGRDDTRRAIRQAGKLTRASLFPDAEAILRRAVDADPDSSAARLELAFVLCKERKLPEAYRLAYDVAEKEPRNAHAYSVLGIVLVTAGRFTDARVVLYNALHLDRSEDLAWSAYGLLDFYENNIESSLANLHEAVFQNGEEPDYLFALAQVAARAERYRDAADAYYRFLSVSKDTDEDRRARIKGLIAFLRYLGQKQSLYQSVGKENAAVPFDLVGNRPIINVKINGHDDPLRFVLDTGSGITVMSDVAAQKLKVHAITRGGYAKGIGGDGRFEIIYGYLKSVEMGGVNLKNIPIYIRKFHDDSQKVDGYIGLALISKFLTTIDYGSRTLSLTKKSDDERSFREASPTLSLPLRLTSSGFLSGEVQLEGVEAPLNFIVDTGASVSVISDEVATIDKIRRYGNSEKLRVIGSAGVTDDVPTFLLPRVSFGRHSRRSIEAIALDLGVINEASGFEQAGILGGNFLRNYSLTFDFKNSKVTFSPITPEN